MEITRILNGRIKYIELSDQEIEKAYRIREQEYQTLDIKAQIMDSILTEEGNDSYDKWNQELPKLTEKATEKSKKLRELFEEASNLTESFSKNLSNNERYWDSYWEAIDFTIEEELRS